MEYTGKLYGKIGRRIIPLTLTSEDVDKLEKENREMKGRISALQYWRDISECDCSSPLPQGGCLRCDLDKLLLLGAERRSEPEVAHPLPPVANLPENARAMPPAKDQANEK
jgi:hypothetical protein